MKRRGAGAPDPSVWHEHLSKAGIRLVLTPAGRFITRFLDWACDPADSVR